ncbi:MAG: hypothetical protein C0467_28060 [Planctomycetaceae bacterium]|nr:hypothetical protein [Planctomycetaceae bacterium]
MSATPHDTPGSDLANQTASHGAHAPGPMPPSGNAVRTINNTVSEQIRVEPSFGPSLSATTGSETHGSISPLPRIPGYEILEVLGRGGMGVVYRAQHLALKRMVALKMIGGAGYISQNDLTRFRIEAEALARLQHPNIVQVYEVGEHDGLPFFSLELVTGGTLAEKLNRTPQPAIEAARVVEQLARAVTTAHAAGIIHRDLKPGNVLLTANGTPKITDFGLAKLVGTDSGQTRTGQVMGTPSYMAPEQAAGLSEVGPTADVYALGAILYDMLTGRPPFQDDTVLGTLEQVRTKEPVAPSRLLSTVPRDIESVCLRCLEKDFWRRYFTAESLADDLRRFLDGQPVLARPVGAFERGMKWVRRKPAVAGLWAAGFLLALAVTGTAVAIGYSTELAEQRQRAVEGEREANTLRDIAESRKNEVEAQKLELEKQQAAIQAASRRAEKFKYIGDMNQAVAAWRENDSVRARGLLALHVPKAGEADRRGFEWHFLNRQFHTERWVWPIPEFVGTPSIDVKDDGSLCVIVPDAQGGIWLGNIGTGAWKNVLKEPIHGASRLAAHRVAFSTPNSGSIAFSDPEGALRPPSSTIAGLQNRHGFDLSPDGSRVAVIVDKELRAYDIASRKLIGSLPNVAEYLRPAFSHDGNTVFAFDTMTQRMIAMNLTTGKSPRTARPLPAVPHQVQCFSALPGVVVWLSPTQIELWQSEQFVVRPFSFKLPPRPTRSQLCMAISTDAKRLAIGGHGASIYIFGASDGRKIGMGGGAEANVSVTNQLVLLSTLTGHESAVAALTFSGNGKDLVSVASDRTVRVWNLEESIPLRSGYVLRPGNEALFAIEKTADGKLSVSDADGRVRRTIPVDAGTKLMLPPIAIPPDARWVTAGSFEVGKPISVWVDERAEPGFVVPSEPDRSTESLVASPDGGFLAVLSVRRAGTGAGIGSPRTQLWDVEGKKLVWERTHGDAGVPVFAASGDRLALYTAGKLSVVAVDTGELLYEMSNRHKIVAAHFLGRGDELLVVEADGTFTHVDLAKRRELTSGKLGQTNPILSAGVSADGTRLATADVSEVRVWDLETGQQTLVLAVDSVRPIRNLFFTRNDRCLIGDPGDGRVFEWDCSAKK